MLLHILFALALSQTLAASPAAQSGFSVPAVQAVSVFPKLQFKQAVYLTSLPNPQGTQTFFVVERDGRIFRFSPDEDGEASTARLFLDLRSKVRTQHPEEGLLCLAFHPRFSQNHQFFVIYSLAGADPRRTVLSRFTLSKNDPDKADPKSEQVIFQVEKKYGNHNGSTLLFGRDGMLYFGLGDGGGAGDPDNHAQDLSSYLGKILRIDVDHSQGGKAYAVPRDNPFVSTSGAKPELWAYGLRNPWRMSFDRASGQLWVGDVGQDRWEEIDRVEKGGNYGWSFKEGTHPFKPGQAKASFIDPVFDYGRNWGNCVIGGYLYRGNAIPGLKGLYIFGDFGSQRVWALQTTAQKGKKAACQELLMAPEAFSSFGEDQNGELYLVGYAGDIYQIQSKEPQH